MRRNDSKPMGLRAIVQDSMSENKITTIFAYISSGTIRVNETMHIEPFGTQIQVKELYVKGKKVKIATEGSNISIKCKLTSNFIQRGGIIYAEGQKSAYLKSFDAKIFFIHGLLDSRGEIIMNLNNKKVEAVISGINGFTNPSSGNFKAFKGAKIVPNIVVDAKMSLKSQYPIERFSEYESLGRFTLYSKDKFVGIGIVK
jgi:translation elongation factor EF-1alpha